MDWVKWLIPLVVIFVFILSNLARITQEEKRNVPRRRPGPGGDNPPRPRRPVSAVGRRPPPVVEEVVVAAVPVPVPAAPASGDVTAGAPAAVVAVKPDTPTAVQLRQLLRSPQTLKTAVVLREVLDGPLCRRRRPGA